MSKDDIIIVGSIPSSLNDENHNEKRQRRSISDDAGNFRKYCRTDIVYTLFYIAFKSYLSKIVIEYRVVRQMKIVSNEKRVSRGMQTMDWTWSVDINDQGIQVDLKKASCDAINQTEIISETTFSEDGTTDTTRETILPCPISDPSGNENDINTDTIDYQIERWFSRIEI